MVQLRLMRGARQTLGLIFGGTRDTIRPMRLVVDTNVLVAATRSRRGASFRLLSEVGKGHFELAVSVPLVLEYEDVLKREASGVLRHEDVDDLIDYLCRVAHRQAVFYLWRPLLRDPDDDMILELAVACGARAIVTFNERDFGSAHRLGVEVWRPGRALEEIGARP